MAVGLLGEMTVRFGADTSKLSAGIGQAKNLLSSLASNPLGAVGAGLGIVAAGAVAVGASSVTAAADFQQSMLKVAAYAGLSKQQTDAMSNSILDMASKLGQSPKAMADAIYPIISSGYSASQALDILNLSAKTAAASGAQMSTVADMLTTSLKASGAPASDAGHYMDMFNKIVSLGKGEVPQYAAVIGKLTLAAGSAHVPFDQMGAALATLTTHGFPSVAQASTSLGNLFTQIGPKVDLVAQHAQKLGISFNENAFKTMSFSQQLDYLQKVTNGNQGELLKLLGGSSLALKAFNALKGSAKDFTDNLNQMKNATGATDDAFKVASSGFNASMARMQASIQVLQVKIGQALLPVLTKLVDAITPIVTGFADIVTGSSPLSGVFQNIAGMVGIMAANWQDFLTSLSPVIKQLQQLAPVFGGILSSALTQFLRLLNDADNIFLSVASGVATIVVPALKILSQIWQGVLNAVTPVIDAIEANLVPAIDNLVSAIAPIIAAILQWIADSGIIPIVFNVVGQAIGIVVNVLSFLVNIIANVIKWLWQFKPLLIGIGILLAAIFLPVPLAIAAIIFAIIGIVNIVKFLIANWGNFLNWWNNLWSQVGAFFVNAWASIQSGAVAAWNGLIAFVRSAGQTLFNVIFAPIMLIGQLFVWLYNHNYYFQALVDSIRNIITAGLAWLVSVWSGFVSWLSGIWQGIASTASSIWQGISGTVQSKTSEAGGWIKSNWDKASAATSQFLGTIWKGITDTWTQISGVFSQAWNKYVQPGLNTIASGISGFFSKLVSDALNFGSNLVNNIANGIRNAAGAVTNAVSSVANNIKSFLGFHSPTERGPGSTADQWSPNLIKMMASGLIAHAPQLSDAAKMVASGLTALQNPPVTLPAPPQISASGNSNRSATITIELDGRVIGRAVAPNIVNDIRVRTGVRA